MRGFFIANHPDSGSVTARVRFAEIGFQLGLRRPLEVREEIVREHARPCRLAYVSDIHLRRGRSRHLAGQVLDALQRARPDAILLGGDLVDQASELDELRGMLDRMLGMEIGRAHV